MNRSRSLFFAILPFLSFSEILVPNECIIKRNIKNWFGFSPPCRTL